MSLLRNRSRLSAACAFLAIMVGTAAPAFAQANETEVYFLRANHEYSDGHSTVSTSRDIVVGRARRGDRSMILQDFQAGAITIESGGRTIATGTASPRRVDAASAYDYSDVRASGDGREVALFNAHMRPLIAQFPAPGPEGSWTARTSLGAIGLAVQGGDPTVRIELRRERLSHQGQELVLIEFEIPAFAYRLPDGAAVTHWARGLAVTDRDFAVIHVAATQHRATAIAADGTVRPFAVRTSLHGIERDGRMRLRLETLPQVAAAVRRVGETRGDPIAALGEGGAAAPFPREVAARLDLASYAIGEGGANPVPVTTGGADPGPISTLPAGSQADVAAFRAQAAEALRSQGMSDQDAARLLNALLEPDRSRELIDRMDELYGYQRQMFRMLPSWEERQRPLSELTPSERALREVIRIYVKQDDTLVMEARLTEARRREEARWVREGGAPDDPEFQARMREAETRHQQILDARYERIRQSLRVAEEQPPAELGNELVPGWISDPANPDAVVDEALYRSLQEAMSSELEEAEEIIRRLREDRERQREQTVYDDTDDFFLNNAFTYTSMIGIVPTDLSRWADWLATQNVRELERLALRAGYPNLASALNDAQNLIRFAGDDGYRRWAMNPPSCNGLGGCGPSYLERWWMRQATVALGDILADSRDIFSTAGLSDIGISGLNLSYLLRDNALQDGDIVDVRITQFGRVLFQGRTNLTNLGERYSQLLRQGVAALEIFAVNEGSASPNTAQIVLDNVVRGNATQSYSLRTGETATLRIETNARGQ